MIIVDAIIWAYGTTDELPMRACYPPNELASMTMSQRDVVILGLPKASLATTPYKDVARNSHETCNVLTSCPFLNVDLAISTKSLVHITFYGRCCSMSVHAVVNTNWTNSHGDICRPNQGAKVPTDAASVSQGCYL